MTETNKSLGQHWLYDEEILESIVQCANIKQGDDVIEVGPGLGTLTDILVKSGANITAVEYDKNLFNKLNKKYSNNSLRLVNEDILKFNFGAFKGTYKIVANIPYYLTSNLVRIISELPNPPQSAALLVQKEVAERIASKPGNMSKLSVFAQNTFDASLGPIVDSEYFTPPPKVDSQVIILHKRSSKLVSLELENSFNKVVKAGFGEKRKKLRSSISGGLQISKVEAESLLKSAGISSDERAQNLSLDEWVELAKVLK